METVIDSFNIGVDWSYIALVVLIPEILFKVLKKEVKNKTYMVLIIALIVTTFFFFLQYPNFENDEQRINFIKSLLVNYCIATSFYEIFLKFITSKFKTKDA